MATDSITEQLLSPTEEMMERDNLTGMARSDALSSIVEEWRRKSSDIESKAKDPLIAVFDKGFATMSVVLNREYTDAKTALEELNCYREEFKEHDKYKDDVVRNLLYGFVESVNFTLDQLVDERNELQAKIDNWNRDEETNLSPLDLPLIGEQSMMEMSADEGPLDGEEGLNSTEEIKDDDQEMEEAIEETNRVVEQGEKKKRSRENKGGMNTLSCSECDFTHFSTLSFIHHLKDNHNKTMGEAHLVFKCDCGKVAQSRSNACTCPIARLSIDYTASAPIRRMNKDKENQTKTSVKKVKVDAKKSDSPTTKAKTIGKGRKCVLCKKRPRTACGYVKHINSAHQVSLQKAGIRHLKCVCGLEATSNSSFKSGHAAMGCGENFKVVRIRIKKEAVEE